MFSMYNVAIPKVAILQIFMSINVYYVANTIINEPYGSLMNIYQCAVIDVCWHHRFSSFYAHKNAPKSESLKLTLDHSWTLETF